MNQVARVFVVINIMLSAAFLMAAGTFLHQNEDWKQKTADVEKSKMETETKLTSQISELDSNIQLLQDDLNTRKSKLTSLQGDLATANSRIESAVDAKNQAERKFAALQETLNIETSKLASISDSVGGLETMIENYRTRAEGAQDKERIAMEAKNKVIGERETLKQEKRDLENTLKETQARLNSTMTELASYRNNYPPPANIRQPLIDGLVIRFDAGTNMVQVNKGSKDGVRLGHKFDIVNGSQYVCTIMIDYIDGSTSVGHISIPSTTGALPMSGYKATKLTGK